MSHYGLGIGIQVISKICSTVKTISCSFRSYRTKEIHESGFPFICLTFKSIRWMGLAQPGNLCCKSQMPSGLVEDSVLLNYTPKVPDDDQKGIRSDTEVDNKRLLRS